MISGVIIDRRRAFQPFKTFVKKLDEISLGVLVGEGWALLSCEGRWDATNLMRVVIEWATYPYNRVAFTDGAVKSLGESV